MRRLTIPAFLAAILTIAPPALAQQSVTANSVVKGRLERGDPTRDGAWTDTYTYDGLAGQELRIFSNVDLRIDGPDRYSRAAGRELVVRLPKNGRYKISASWNSYGAGPVAYELGVWTVITEQQPAELKVGQTVQGGISTTDAVDTTYSRNRTDTYSYAASAGEAVTFHLEGQPTSGLVLTLVKADGDQDYQFAQSTVADLHAYFPDAGTHQLIVSSEGGNYSLFVQPRQFVEAAAPMAHLTMGQSVELTPSPASAVTRYGLLTNVYAVSAQPGDGIAVLSSGAPSLRVTAPDGSPLGPIFTASSAGDYRIEAGLPIPGSSPVTLRLMSIAEGNAIQDEARARAERERVERERQIADLMRRGDEALNSGDNEAALAAYSKIHPLDPSNVQAFLGAGVAAYRSNKRISAEMDFTSVLSLDPGNEVARKGLEGIRQAEAAEQRANHLAYEAEQREREAEEDALISNVLGGFVAGVNAGVAINNAQAEAEAAAAQARADADRRMREIQTAQQQSALPLTNQTTGGSSGSSGVAKSMPVSPGGAQCARVEPTGHSFPVGANAGRFERYDYRLTNSCGIPVVFSITFANGSTRDVTLTGTSRDWFCTVGFLGNTDCVGGIAKWSYR